MQMWTIIDPQLSETFLIESLGNADADIQAEGGIWAGTAIVMREDEIVLKSVLIQCTLLQVQLLGNQWVIATLLLTLDTCLPLVSLIKYNGINLFSFIWIHWIIAKQFYLSQRWKKKTIYSKKQKWTIMEQLDASLMRRILMVSPVEMKIKILC